MKKLFLHITIFSIAFLALLGFMGVNVILGLETSKEGIQEKKERKDEIASEKAKISRDLKAKKQTKQAYWQELNQITHNLAVTDSQLGIKERELDRKKNQIQIASDTLAQAQKDLETNQKNFESRLRIYYKSGQSDIINIIVDSKDLSDLVYRIHYTDCLLSFDEEMIKTIREQKVLLSEEKDKRTKEVREKEQLYNEIWDLRTSYNEDKKEQEQRIKKLQKNIRELESVLAELDREDMEIAFFLQAAAKGGLSTNFDGSFSCPLHSYQVSSGFGMRRHPIFRRVRMHNGIDLSSSYGNPAAAAGAGRVIFAGWKTGYGNTVMIDHGKGMATLYGHLSSILVSVGQDVAEGQPIGKVGSTGWSTGNHLHFEVRENGKAKNPTKYVNF